MNDQRLVVVRTCQCEVAKFFGRRRSPTGTVVPQSRGTSEVVHFAPAVHRVEVAGKWLYGVMREVLRHTENLLLNQKFSDCQFIGYLPLDFRLQRWREF